MYPSINMAAFAYPERDVVAVFQRHNDWIRDYSATRHSVSLVLVVYRCRTSMPLSRSCNAWPGWAYVACPFPTAPPDKPYHHPDYEPFWCAAEEAGIPISMHIFCGSTPDMGLPAHWGGRARASSATLWPMVASWPQLGNSSAVASPPVIPRSNLSVLNLKPAGSVMSCSASTMPPTGRGGASPDLTMAPSAYFQRQFYATFEDDAIGVLTRHFIGVDNLIWGNDYPHHDSIWPHSQEVITRIFAGVPEDEKAQMTFGNVTKPTG